MDGDKKSASGGQQDQPGWVFKPGGSAETPPPPPAASKETPVPPAPAPRPSGKKVTEQSVEWTASEFIAHQKNVGWYMAVILCGVALAIGVYFFTHDEISTAVVLVVTIAFAVIGARKPRVMAYRLDDKGLTVGQRFHPYSDFKSFTLVEEGAFASLTFLPLKRFMPAVNVYFAPDDADDIMDVVAAYLPYENREPGVFDSLIRRIRF
jgi:uncharacterized membrane protein YobD (UPF0266 family)